MVMRKFLVCFFARGVPFFFCVAMADTVADTVAVTVAATMAGPVAGLASHAFARQSLSWCGVKAAGGNHFVQKWPFNSQRR